MGLARRIDTPALSWMPSAPGFHDVRDILREAVGRIAGA